MGRTAAGVWAMQLGEGDVVGWARITLGEQELMLVSSSGQAMGSAFEQALWILLDAVVPRLQAATGQTSEDLRRRHTNLE